MSDHDNDNNNQEDVGSAVGSCDDDGSILSEALASGQAVQICRKGPKKNPGKGMSLMQFFGAEEDDDCVDNEVLTAEPLSLQNKRRQARASREKKELEKEFANPRITRGLPRRSRTFEADGPTYRRTSRALDRAPQQVRALSPTRMSFHTGNANAPGLRRTKTTDLTTPSASFAPPLASFLLGEDSTSSDSPRSQSYTDHEETIKRLTVQDDDIQKLLEDPQAFAKLQKVLRKHGAVTNEVLRQVLPLYVKHQVNSQAAKEADRKKREEEEKCMDRIAIGREE